jgi:hypothetical protein
MFRTAFKRSRCIVPASGYYEWKTINGAKQPFYFSATDGGMLSIAGLWDEWNDRSSPAGPPLSCTLIVTAANKFAGRFTTRFFFNQRILGRGWTAPRGQSFSNLQAKICFRPGQYRNASTDRATTRTSAWWNLLK